MRFAAAFATVALVAGSLAGCGSSSSSPESPRSGQRRTGGPRALAGATARSCASRAVCSVGPYRCSAVRASRGTAVNCARPGRTIAFIAR